jgi:hypothetical protein
MCNINPKYNQLGIVLLEDKKIICELCLMTQKEPKNEIKCIKTYGCD